MFSINRYSILAIIGGCLLALMIQVNSILAANTSSLNASWFAHAIGALTAWCLILAINSKPVTLNEKKEKPPIYFYLGGIPGALTVILASIAVNSDIGLSGTLALGLIGQLLFSMVCEVFGLFRLEQKQFRVNDLLPILLISAGSLLLIYTRY